MTNFALHIKHIKKLHVCISGVKVDEDERLVRASHVPRGPRQRGVCRHLRGPLH